jgi:hypothetical protein
MNEDKPRDEFNYSGKFFDKLYSKYSAVAIKKVENKVDLIEKNNSIQSMNIADTYKAVMWEIFEIDKRIKKLEER